ncbi:hypothetical protein GCM10023210_29380 [Chryseobacterium ginsengisoli]|uniref:DUF6705 domain-containing protein n=1 Tax=Chryseobacterium ginsengisoli TaxID=363853 RepID=A0ABP9MJ36_9FLAO
MKIIITILALRMLISSLTSCQAIIDLHNTYPTNTPNTYYKDIGDKFNPYEGTWVYDDGTSYFKIILVKKIKFPIWQYFQDCIIGGFQYKKNGVEVINNLNIIQSDPIKYPISGNWIGEPTLSPFDQYTTDNNYVKLSIKENDCFSNIYLRVLTLNGQPLYKYSK